MKKFMNFSEYAAHRGVSRPYISKLKSHGVLILHDKSVDVAASDAVLNGPAVAPTENPDGDPTTLTDARVLETVYKGKRQRLRFEQEAGKLIDAGEAEAKWAEAGVKIRDAVLGIPTRMVNRLPVEIRRQVLAVAEEETRAVLTALADEFESEGKNELA